jgi:hypothetical protein
MQAMIFGVSLSQQLFHPFFCIPLKTSANHPRSCSIRQWMKFSININRVIHIILWFWRGKPPKDRFRMRTHRKLIKNLKFYAVDSRGGITREVIFESFDTENLQKRNLYENIEWMSECKVGFEQLKHIWQREWTNRNEFIHSKKGSWKRWWYIPISITLCEMKKMRIESNMSIRERNTTQTWMLEKNKDIVFNQLKSKEGSKICKMKSYQGRRQKLKSKLKLWVHNEI